MNDLGDSFREMRKGGQVKRAKNRGAGAEYLTVRNIPYVSKNNGAHLIVEGIDCFIDYWPGTGRWKTRKGKTGFGVRWLVDYIEMGLPDEKEENNA